MKYESLESVSKFLSTQISGEQGRHIFLMDGEMGAGKTTLVSKILQNIDKSISTTSPTFTIINQYTENIFHIDLYRIESESDLQFLGLHEILTGKNIVFVEWSSLMGSDFEKIARPYMKIKINKISENEREFILENIK